MRPIEIAVEAAGSQQAVADVVGVSQGAVSQWVNDETAIDVKHFPKIEEASGGKATVAMLLEDQMARPARMQLRRKRA